MSMIQFPVIDPVATGANICRLRKDRGLTVRDLQHYFGFEEPQAIYKWQRGQSLPSVDSKGSVALLRKVYTIIGQGDVPSSGIGKADAQMFRQNFTASGEGMGVINELLAGYPRAQSHRRRCDQQDLVLI